MKKIDVLWTVSIGFLLVVIGLPALTRVLSAVPLFGVEPERSFEVRVIDDGNAVEITRYIGGRVGVRIPSTMQGLPVTAIGDGAFSFLRSNVPQIYLFLPRLVIGRDSGWWLERIHLRSVNIPEGVTHIV